MRYWIALMICVGIGYIAEVYFENPNRYVVWIGFTVMAFGAYVCLTGVTSFAFALPVAIVMVGAASVFAYIKGEMGFIIFGVYGAILAILFSARRFHSWDWADWRYPSKFMRTLTARIHKSQ